MNKTTRRTVLLGAAVGAVAAPWVSRAQQLKSEYKLSVVGNRPIPLSDGAGEVVAVGSGVTTFTPGDRVVATFNQVPPAGSPSGAQQALGSPLDGMLAELVVLYEDGVLAIPENLSYEEAACLPVAGVTAWRALTEQVAEAVQISNIRSEV
jgi:NADPH:quinone reductase-like Zn-dependent oxidoreductase